MTSRKPSGVKKRLYSKIVENYPVPTWVVVRTKRKVRTNPQRRNWRRRKMKIR